MTAIFVKLTVILSFWQV